MSTMLATTNPAAVNEIDPGKDRRRPYLGQRVIFHSRPGEARFGRLMAVADVINVEDDDHLELLIHYAADDALVRWKIPRRTDQNPFNSWSFTDWDEQHYKPGDAPTSPPEPTGRIGWEEVKEMRNEILQLRGRTKDLESSLQILKTKGGK